MPISFAIILGIVQGFTEFLPVSSDGHLVVVQVLVGQALQLRAVPLAFDVALHAATLIVTAVFLRSDIVAVARNMFKRGASGAWARRLILLGVVASLPVAFVGIFFKDFIEHSFSSAFLAGVGFFVTAILLELAHRKQSLAPQGPEKMSLVDSEWPLPTVFAALLIGIAQATAVLPGISRSGTTITSALLLGVPAHSAVRFSFLLALPAVLGAVLLEARSITNLPADYHLGLITGFVITLVVGWFAIRLVPIIVSQLKLRWFACYLVVLGTFVILFA